jgi:CspA family cold shock protein
MPGVCVGPFLSWRSVVTDRIQGLVKWYDAEKGYGFISVSGRTKDIFFHAKQWNASGLTTPPVESEPLLFDLSAGPKGDFATNIARGA